MGDSGQGCTSQKTCCLSITTKLEIVIVLFIFIIGCLVAFIIFLKQHQIKNLWQDYIDRGKQARGEDVKQRRPRKYHGGGKDDSKSGSRNGNVVSYDNQQNVNKKPI